MSTIKYNKLVRDCIPEIIEAGGKHCVCSILSDKEYLDKLDEKLNEELAEYGRNFLGTPPQGRADYAFFQHILKSMKPDTGRCAILFPHGVLFRNEEAAMREKLIKSDLVDCVIGLGPNLFFNAPMEACIVICRMPGSKPPAHKGKILLINAVNEVTRKNAQSYLEDHHIRKIADAYAGYGDIEGFARVIAIEDTEKNNYSLSIPLYISAPAEEVPEAQMSLDACHAAWQASSYEMHEEYEELLSMLEMGGETDAESEAE